MIPSLALTAALAGTGTLGLLALTAQVSSAATPDDYLCAVGASSQSALEGSAFTIPLEVEISSTACSDPTPDTASTSVSFALVGTSSASATFTTTPITTVTGYASVSAVANDSAGTYSVSASSPSSASSSSPSVTFSLTNVAPLSDTMSPDVPSYESTTVGTDFALALAVSVRDAEGAPAADVPVLFVAPTTGPSGTFLGGTTSYYVDTDAQGVASAPAFAANGTSGGYAIEVDAGGYATPIAFAMTNEALTVMSVSSVTPNVVSRGSARDVVISGSGFASGAALGFSSPGVTVVSSTLISSSEISANIAVSTTARLGASSVTVTDPSGSSATGTYAFTVAPLSATVAEPLKLGFAHGASGLSGAQERSLRAYVDRLAPGSFLVSTGYAANAALASQRALVVARAVRSLDPRLHVVRRVVVSAAQSKVVVEVR